MLKRKNRTQVLPETQKKSTTLKSRKITKKSCSESFSKKLKGLDIYGEQIKLTYKGDDTFKTNIGSIFSIILLMILGSYGVFRTYILFTLSDSIFNGFDFV